MPEGYKNTNQQFQDKYKKKATRKDLQEIKTSISQKKKKKIIRKMQLFFHKANTADSTAKSSYDFPHCCGQKHISHYFWKR